MKRLLPLTVLLLSLCSGGFGADSLQLEANENIFCVLAAINAAGYDDGLRLPDNHPLRIQLREYLASQDLKSVAELKKFFGTNGRRKSAAQDYAQYLSYALSVTGPPDFGWKTRDVEIPPDAKALEGLTPLLIDFYREARLDRVWRNALPAYEREMEKYQAPIIAMTQKVDGYLRVPSAGYLGRHFQVNLDLLSAPQQVQVRNYGDDANVIVTHSAEPKMYDIRHAYLHYQVDPIVIKYGIDLQQKRSLLDLVQLAPLEDTYKSDFVMLTNESLIKAIESRLDKNPGAVDMAMKQGFVMTKLFSEQLPVFEKQQQGLRFYLEDMVKEIDLKAESARISGVKFDAGQLQRKGKQIVTDVTPELSQSGKTNAQAEELYTARTLDKAKDLYLKSLQQKGSDEDHSQAWFGLGRIALLEKQPEAAVKLFDKAITSSPDAFTKGWSYVYLARLAKAANEPAKAAQYYQLALAVPGASEKVMEAATKEAKTINQETSK
ncbi:MAG: Tetratricopeptide 2 repeat protein [Bryobacterales bacterium]|nr:Tetratricopeptide 2 repeat protein [Bryobacterales bacterium]